MYVSGLLGEILKLPAYRKPLHWYLDCLCVVLMAELRKRGIVTKLRTLKSGAKVGGIAFTRGSPER